MQRRQAWMDWVRRHVSVADDLLAVRDAVVLMKVLGGLAGRSMRCLWCASMMVVCCEGRWLQ